MLFSIFDIVLQYQFHHFALPETEIRATML